MAKSKNHTNRNKSRKDHKNGITRPRPFQFSTKLGICHKFKRNLKASRKGQISPHQQLKRFFARRKAEKAKTVKAAAQKKV